MSQLNLIKNGQDEIIEGQLLVRPLPDKARVLYIGAHTYIIVNESNELCFAQSFSRKACTVERINYLLNYFGESPLTFPATPSENDE